jgi:hypothetical protein
MYTVINFKTKKALKEAFKSKEQIRVFQPNGDIFGHTTSNGRVCLEGPHYPKAHTWYCSVEIKDNIITKIIN